MKKTLFTYNVLNSSRVFSGVNTLHSCTIYMKGNEMDEEGSNVMQTCASGWLRYISSFSSR